jgi:hypothetical protein
MDPHLINADPKPSCKSILLHDEHILHYRLLFYNIVILHYRLLYYNTTIFSGGSTCAAIPHLGALARGKYLIIHKYTKI